jgi:putative DNA-invertase from lambdoid prophage Rac
VSNWGGTIAAMRVALYHRVSTLDQNPALARDELRAAARGRGGEVVLDVEETGSGAKTDRPGLARVMDAARAGRLDAVLVWKLDRFGRSALDLLSNVRALRDAGVRFVATSQGVEISRDGGAVGQLLFTVLAGVAEFERELTRERTTLALSKARKRGVKLGRPRATVSDPMLDSAIEWHRRLGSWRKARGRLRAEGFQNVPSFATLARRAGSRTKTPG